jgi:hypothetical protein
MVHVLSSPENAGGFFLTGSMDWKGRTQECSSRRARQSLAACGPRFQGCLAFEGLCR